LIKDAKPMAQPSTLPNESDRVHFSDLTCTNRPAFSIGGLGMLAIALTGCMSPEQERLVNLNEDRGACFSMGARYGSSAHTECMLRQQERRDNEGLRLAEQARIHSEIARNAQEMREDRRRHRRDEKRA
jgi:hypothetical protein